MNAKKIFTIMTLTLGGAASIAAAPLTPAEALQRAGTRTDASPVYQSTIKDTEGNPAIYVYTYSGTEGFMLLPADDAAAPMLGYSREGTFSTDGAPESLRSWIGGYSSQIAKARKLDAVPWQPAATRAGELPEIKPLLTTTWDQRAPYNNLCPEVNGRRSVTGCVATAMAQVMNYWKYPAVGTGSITYSPKEINRDLTMDFSEYPFDWENMADSYRKDYTAKQANAVSMLMRACGYSVQMNYTPYESGAYAYEIANALTTYFGYDKGVSRKERVNYSQNSWKELIHGELTNVGPVIYNGVSTGGAHCFVCDGYDGKGYFHINWGWSGVSDGYFLLEELTPKEVGTGGHYGGYNMNQDAIIGITPPVGRLIVNELYVDNAANDSGNVRGWGYTYRINDYSNIRLAADITVAGGHVSSPLFVTVYETDPSTLKNLSTVLETTFTEPINDSEGNAVHYTSVNLSGCDVSKLYTINVAYNLKGQKQDAGNLRIAASSGVGDIAAGDSTLSIFRERDILKASDGGAEISVYSLEGALVARARGEVSLAALSKGIYIARASGSGGSSATLKLHLR